MEKSLLRVVVGAGEYDNNPKWTQFQEDELDLLDQLTWEKKFKRESIDAILAEHVWEHLTWEEGLKAAKNCFLYLKPGGYLRCAVPDGYFLNKDYQNTIKIGGPGDPNHPAASHKIVYNYRLLTNLFESIGFQVNLLEYFDENGNFHQSEWSGEQGIIFRSKKFDPRNKGDKLIFPSLIVDIKKLKSQFLMYSLK